MFIFIYYFQLLHLLSIFLFLVYYIGYQRMVKFIKMNSKLFINMSTHNIKCTEQPILYNHWTIQNLIII